MAEVSDFDLRRIESIARLIREKWEDQIPREVLRGIEVVEAVVTAALEGQQT